MKVTLPEKMKLKKREIIIYVVIVLICIISVIVAFYVQFYGRVDFGKILGIDQSENIYGTKTEEEIENLTLAFDNIYNNSISYEEDVENKKEDKSKELVYTQNEIKEIKQNSYDIDIHVPFINIDNEVIDEYNSEIEDFNKKAEDVLKSENKNIIYTVNYTANVQNGILSLILHSNLKEGSNPQREIIQTYNYDLRNNKKITLEEMLKIVDIDIQVAQDTIKSKITEEQNRVNELNNLGYTIYSRDVNNEIYNIENIDDFYVTKDSLYIIFAYGNQANTSEKDVIVF